MRITLLALAALVGGCHWNLNDPGTDPIPTQLYFPSAIAMDPGGRYAYIANGNADLKYGGGTVMVADMLVFECTIARYRQLHPAGPLDVAPPMSPSCGDPASFDPIIEGAKCRPDPIDPTIVDCDEKAFVLPNATVRVGNFASGIRIHRIDKTKRRLFVVVRGDPSITEIDVDLGGDLTMPGVLNCFNDVRSLTQRKGYDAVNNVTIAPPPCDATWLVQEYTCDNKPTCTTGKDGMGLTQLASEPFGMELDVANNRLLVSHLATGQVSLVDINVTANKALKSISDPFFPPDTLGRHGGFALAQKDPGDPSSLWYLTSSVNPQIASFRVGRADVIIPSFAFGLSASFAQGTDVRAISFEPGGQRAFVTENNPPSLLTIDTSARTDGGGGTPNNIVRDIVDVCQTPSHMGVRRINRPGAPGTPTQRSTRIVVVCFLSSQLMVVDPDRPGVNDTIFSGFGGPNDLDFNFLDDGAVAAPEALPARPRMGFVTNYTESTVSMVDFEPGSVSENRVIARLGFPPDGFQP
ncbi:MAG: hypothetical protein JWN44_4798 [Myxococcales bacterium]|nr:hypothetical protein [Myxococcales bacterium]